MSEKLPKYYLVEKGVVYEIDFKENKQLKKQSVYHSFGINPATQEKFVFYDLDKNTVLPYVKYLMENPGESKGVPPILLLIIIVLIVFVLIFFIYFKNSSDNLPVDVSTIPIIETPVFSSPIPITNTPNNTGVTIPLQNNISSQNENKGVLEISESQFKSMTYQIEDMQRLNSRVSEDLLFCKEDFTEAKELSKTQLQENLQLIEENKKLKSDLFSTEQMYIFLGKTVFDLCEKQDADSKCKELIFNFYTSKLGNIESTISK